MMKVILETLRVH